MGDNLEDLGAIINDEIASAKRQLRRSNLMHNISICIVIVCGGLTTYIAAVSTEPNAATPILAFFTTIAGTFEKTFSFGKNAAGYREAKTRFQNLRLEYVRHDGDLSDEQRDALIEDLRKIRILKTELTS